MVASPGDNILFLGRAETPNPGKQGDVCYSESAGIVALTIPFSLMGPRPSGYLFQGFRGCFLIGSLQNAEKRRVAGCAGDY